MITRTDLRRLAKARLADAMVLFRGKRYDGAIYLCGYTIELVLKARICTTLQWKEYPETVNEFRDYNSLKTHKLDVLLHFSGREARVKTRHLAEWSEVAKWEPEVRYRKVGSATRADARAMLQAAGGLLKVL